MQIIILMINLQILIHGLIKNGKIPNQKLHKMKILIFGSTGWLGRATISYLVNRFNNLDLTLISSVNKSFTYREKRYEVFDIKYLETLKNNSFDYFFNFAFLTGNDAAKHSEQNFNNITSKIIDSSESFIRNNKIKKTLLTSSGAVYWVGTEKETPYAKQKLNQENKIISICNKTETELSVARIFALIANHYQTDYEYAFSSFINQAKNNNSIAINSKVRVVRSYLFFDLLLDYFFELGNGVFDAWNFNIDIYDLASVVASIYNSKIEVEEDYFQSTKNDEYISKDETFQSYFPKNINIEKKIESIINYTENEKNIFSYS